MLLDVHHVSQVPGCAALEQQGAPASYLASHLSRAFNHAHYTLCTQDFSRAIELDPNSADFYHNRGFSYRKAVSRDLQPPIWAE